jgi:hypothetical protein
MYTATLGCGSVLSYETPSFAPTKGETVPCRSYCVVIRRGRAQEVGSSRRHVRRTRPRQRQELLEWLDGCPSRLSRFCVANGSPCD